MSVECLSVTQSMNFIESWFYGRLDDNVKRVGTVDKIFKKLCLDIILKKMAVLGRYL